MKDHTFDKRIVSFVLGEAKENNIVKGVVVGIRSLTLGERASFQIKSIQAFGKQGSKVFNIQPNQDVMYHVTLFNFVDVSQARIKP